MSLAIVVVISMLAIGGTFDAVAQAAIQDRVAAATSSPTPKPKAPPISAPPPSEHYAAAHAGATGHPWKF